MKRFLPLLLALAVPVAMAADPRSNANSFHAKLKPKKDHEECQRIAQGESRRYDWRADAPVDFNIHYHRGNDVIYAVKREAIPAANGTFTADTAEDYCWMWTSNSTVEIKGQIEKK